MKYLFAFLLLGFLFFGARLIAPMASEGGLLIQGDDLMSERPEGYPVATLAGGCFWCTESEFRALDGVLHTRVGYMGGKSDNPTYKEISTGKSGHAEVIEVTFDPEKITYETLLEFFLTKAHDPTQLNRQGVDVGTQYRSEIFIHSEEQAAQAAAKIQEIDARGVWKNPIVTKVSPAQTFWDGEEYHQQYYEKYREDTGRDHIRVIMKKAGGLKE